MGQIVCVGGGDKHLNSIAFHDVSYVTGLSKIRLKYKLKCT